MAITQERMIAILSATRRFYNDLQSLRSTIRQTIGQIPASPTLDECLTAIRALQFADELSTSREADAMLLASEERHYELSFRRNKRSAEYARRRRSGHDGSLAIPKRLLSIADLDRSTFDEAAEKAIASSTTPTYHPTAPLALSTQKPLDASPKTKPPAQPALSSPKWTPEDDVIAIKLKSNEIHRSFKMREPYPDPYDASQPLTLEDAINNGHAAPPSSTSIF